MNIVMIDNDYNFCDNLTKYLKSCGQMNVINVFNNSGEAVNYIEKNNKLLELVMIDLEVPNININSIISSTPKGCNIIALSEIPETVNNYINYPYFQRIFQKPISFSALTNYLSIQNGIETLEDSKKAILGILSDLGFNLNHSGTMYLIEGIAIAMKHKMKKLSEIYTLLAYNHNNDPKIIGWSINNAINKAIKSCNEEKIQNFFKIYDNRKLTAKYIFSYFLNYNISKDTLKKQY